MTSLIRKFFGRGREVALSTDVNRKPAQELVDRGIAQQAAGELAEATASFVQATANEPEYVAAHYNLACTHLLRQQLAEAETAFRTALRLRDALPEAWVGLAAALEGQGRNEEALSALDKALVLRSDYVGALLNSLALLRKLGRVEGAIANSRRVLELEPDNHLAHGTLGLGLHSQGRLTEAESSYRQALTFNPEYSEARTNLAMVLRATGRNAEAIPLLFDAIASEPANANLRVNLAEALHGLALTAAGETERKVLLNLCLDDNLLGFITPTIATLTKNSEGFRALQDSARRREDPFLATTPPVAAFLRDPLLLAALPRVPLADVEMEAVFTHVRRWILFRFNASSGQASVDSDIPAEFICALSRQCFFSCYAFFVEDDERRHGARLRESILEALRNADAELRTLEPSLLVASLYESLHELDGIERLLAHPKPEWSEAFVPIVQEQVEDRLRERAIAAGIPSITAIDDDVSKAVRAQYEINPYPRWTTAQTPSVDSIEHLARRLRPGHEARVRARPISILVAGCGTGRQPIAVARTFPDSEVLAVDLSLASLAYAARMTEKFGLANITYRQADILKLDNLDRRFAMIECCGVLHHLDDPMAGWRVLVSLLEPDGLMKIALYSEAARNGVRAAWEIARSSHFPGTAEGVRNCRKAIMELPDGHPARDVLTNTDFYALDGCRDFIMHVREHQFTIPRIEACLDQLGLHFLGFECSPTTLSRFNETFPDRTSDNDLQAWHRFEEKHPKTFIGTYVFWCCIS